MPRVAETEKRLAEFFASSTLGEMPMLATAWHVAAAETELRKACDLFRDYLVARMADVHASTSPRLGDPDDVASYFDDFVSDNITGPLSRFGDDEDAPTDPYAEHRLTASQLGVGRAA